MAESRFSRSLPRARSKSSVTAAGGGGPDRTKALPAARRTVASSSREAGGNPHQFPAIQAEFLQGLHGERANATVFVAQLRQQGRDRRPSLGADRDHAAAVSSSRFSAQGRHGRPRDGSKPGESRPRRRSARRPA